MAEVPRPSACSSCDHTLNEPLCPTLGNAQNHLLTVHIVAILYLTFEELRFLERPVDYRDGVHAEPAFEQSGVGSTEV